MMEVAPDVGMVMNIGRLLILGGKPIDRLIVNTRMIFLNIVIGPKVSVENPILIESVVM